MRQPEPFGKFVLLGQVAVGGMAEIYKAHYADPAAPQFDIAIKRILPSYTEDESFVTMFKDEGNIALRLQHPNIVRVYEVGEVNNDWYIAMEYVHGTDLRVLSDACERANRRFTSTQVARIICETAKALDYAHKCTDETGASLNIVHRDCTPHNIMITFDGQVKLMDFGIAKAASRATKTRVGTVKGKSSYMSPEQARGKNLDGRSDMFTLGTVGWEMLTGHRLFKASNDMEAIGKILKIETVHPSDIDAKIPRELGDIIMTTLEKDRDARYATCGELAEALEAYLRMRGDRSDAQLGLVVQQLLGKNGHSASEIPMYVPGDGIVGIDEQGNFVSKGQVAPMAAPIPMQQPQIQSSMSNNMIQGQRSMTGMGPVGGNLTPIGATQSAVYDPSMSVSALPPKRPIGLIAGSVALAILMILFLVLGIHFISKTPNAADDFAIPEARIQLKTTPSGATIIVNGEKLDNKTPFAYKAKLGTDLEIEFQLDGYENAVERRETRLLSQNISVDLITKEEANKANLEALPELVIHTSPEGANIKINGEDMGTSPVTLKDLKFGTETKIEVSADGYDTKETVFVASKGVDPETTVSLVKTEKAAKVAAAAPSKPATTKQPTVTKKPASSVKKDKASSGSGTGTITVKAKPWAVVSIDGTRVGSTPVSKRSLKAGSHKVELNHPAKQKKVNKTVTIKSDADTEISYDFNADKWL